MLEKLLILTTMMGKNIALMPEGQLNASVILQGQCQYMSWPWIHPPVIIHTHTACKKQLCPRSNMRRKIQNINQIPSAVFAKDTGRFQIINPAVLIEGVSGFGS